MVDSVYTALADLFEYPGADLLDRARSLKQRVALLHPEAAQALAEFVDAVETATPASLEELYTATFDLNPVCSPYVGYHLFGESYRRGAFLARLQETYRTQEMDLRGELPDHLAPLLRLYAGLEDPELVEDLRDDCLVPALSKMLRAFDGGSPNPYQTLIQAGLLIIEGPRAC